MWRPRMRYACLVSCDGYWRWMLRGCAALGNAHSPRAMRRVQPLEAARRWREQTSVIRANLPIGLRLAWIDRSVAESGPGLSETAGERSIFFGACGRERPPLRQMRVDRDIDGRRRLDVLLRSVGYAVSSSEWMRLLPLVRAVSYVVRRLCACMATPSLC